MNDWSNLEVELIVAIVRLRFSEIEADSGRSEARPCVTPRQRVFAADGADALCALLPNFIACEQSIELVDAGVPGDWRRTGRGRFFGELKDKPGTYEVLLFP